MKKLLNFSNIVCFILMSIILNSYMLVKICPYTLILIIPIFLLLNILPGINPKGTKKLKLILLNHGMISLTIFFCSLIPSLIWHTILAFLTIPGAYMDWVWSTVYCICTSAVIFWNGVLCVYLTSTQMGLKWRVLGAVCGMIPILNLFILARIIEITAEEVEFEIEKEAVTSNPELAEICKTKYPIVLVHGISYRDNKILNYWGRIPRTLKLHGATILYGRHQSALTIKESARELNARIRIIVERSGCEKVNIIAHSKGGLDCRYAISEFGLAPYVASLTTISTPHRGCIFAEKLLYAIPEKIKNKIAKIYNKTFLALGDETPDFLATVSDLTAESCEKLNEQLVFPEGIYSQSVGSVLNQAKKGQFPFSLFHRYVKNFDGENDGLVGENSFAWGEKYTLIRSNDPRGVSHCDITDLEKKNIKGFDVRAFYTDLVSDLKNRGL